MDLSIVIPLFNESDSIFELNKKINEIISNSNIDVEIIYVDDGSKDDSWKKIADISEKNQNIIGLRFLKNYGKSMALSAGFSNAKGSVVITMDADLQDDPNEIIPLYNMVQNEDYDLVSGWKKKRYDSVIFKNIPSKLFNWAARKSSGINLHDFKLWNKGIQKICYQGD